jgi:hypothetical protein
MGMAMERVAAAGPTVTHPNCMSLLFCEWLSESLGTQRTLCAEGKESQSGWSQATQGRGALTETGMGLLHLPSLFADLMFVQTLDLQAFSTKMDGIGRALCHTQTHTHTFLIHRST